MARVWHDSPRNRHHKIVTPVRVPSDLGFLAGAGEGNRTLMTSLEGWGSAIELRPRHPAGIGRAAVACWFVTRSVPALSPGCLTRRQRRLLLTAIA